MYLIPKDDIVVKTIIIKDGEESKIIDEVIFKSNKKYSFSKDEYKITLIGNNINFTIKQAQELFDLSW